MKWNLTPVLVRDQVRYKRIPEGSVKIWDYGIKLSPDLVDGLDLRKDKLKPYINEETRIIGFEKGSEGYLIKVKEGKKVNTYMIQATSVVKLLNPEPRIKGVYKAFWDGNMLIMDFSKEVTS